MSSIEDKIKMGESCKEINLEIFRARKKALIEGFNRAQASLDKEISSLRKQIEKTPIQKLADQINETNNTDIHADVHKEDALAITRNGGGIVVNQIGSDTFDLIHEAGYRVYFIGSRSTPDRLTIFLKKL